MSEKAPKPPKENRTAPVAVRTTPTLKAQLQEAANNGGRSVTQEIERRLEASLAGERVRRTVETDMLLNAIAREIDQIEQQRGAFWHEDLGTWGAVAEALSSGVIDRHRPDHPQKSPKVGEAMDKLFATRDQKGPYIAMLQLVGINAKLDRNAIGIDRGLFATGKANDLLKFLDMKNPANHRTEEREAVSRITDLTPDKLALVQDAVERLAELDVAEAEADEVVSEALNPFAEKVVEGRKWYRRWRQRQAELARAERAKTGAYEHG